MPGEIGNANPDCHDAATVPVSNAPDDGGASPAGVEEDTDDRDGRPERSSEMKAADSEVGRKRTPSSTANVIQSKGHDTNTERDTGE